MLMIREMKKSYIYYKEYILIFTKQEKKMHDKTCSKRWTLLNELYCWNRLSELPPLLSSLFKGLY